MRKLPISSLAASAAVLSIILSACGGSDATPTLPAPAATTLPRASATPSAVPAVPAVATPTTAPSATPAPTPTRVIPTPTPTSVPQPAGSLRVAQESLVFNLLPQALQDRRWQEPLYDYVIGSKTDGSLDAASGLAKSWESSADGKTWTLRLRDGVTFHNGVKATAKDVQFTIQFHARQGSVSASREQIGRLVEAVETPDDLTLIVKLKTTDIFFDVGWISSQGREPGVLLPKADLETRGADGFNKAPVGSGPYKFKEINVGRNMVYEAVRGHWYYGTPKYQNVEFIKIPDPLTQIALLKTGGAEVIEVNRAHVPDLRKAGYVLSEKQGAAVAWMQFHAQWQAGNPIGNVKVRRALSLAVDRQTIVDTFLNGLGTPSVSYPVVSWDPAYKPVPVPRSDLAQAKQLLQEAGYPTGFKMDVVIFPFFGLPEAPEIMEAIATRWESLGIKVTRVPTDYNSFRDVWNNQKLTNPTVSGILFTPNRPVASVLAIGGMTKQSISRVTEDPELGNLANRYAGAKSRQEYIQAGQAAQQAVTDQAIHGPLFEAGEIIAASSKVTTGWELGRVSYSININMLLTGK